MRAMTYRGPYRVRVEEKPDPRIEHPNDAIVRVERAAICGSDLHLYHGMMPDTRVGHTFGHEFIGVVEQVGPSVRSLDVGDRVMVPFHISCGSCWFCARGLFTNCHNVNPNTTAVGGIFGYSHTTGGDDGGQAERVRVPFADVGPQAQPLAGPAGVVKRYAYRRFSEGRLAHWMLLVVGDRIDVATHRVTDALRGRPDRLLHETGARSERGTHPVRARLGSSRRDRRHQLLDPVVANWGWLAAIGGVVVVVVVVRRLLRC